MKNNNEKTIAVSHINIRQSISFLVLKLVATEIVITILILLSCFPLACIDLTVNPFNRILSLHNGIFIALMTGKLFLSLFIILQWLDEYYEIKPTKFTHRTGSFFKKEQSYTYTHIMSIDLEQSFWGRVFNYGTIHMYDRYINKHLYLYLIHNPKRYYNILKTLLPFTDSENLITREHLIEEENNTV